MNRLLEETGGGSGEPCSPYSIEEQSVWISSGFRPKLFGGFYFDEAKVSASSYGYVDRGLKVCSGIAVRILDTAQQQHINRSAFLMKKPRDRGSVAAVVAASADY